MALWPFLCTKKLKKRSLEPDWSSLRPLEMTDVRSERVFYDVDHRGRRRHEPGRPNGALAVAPTHLTDTNILIMQLFTWPRLEDAWPPARRRCGVLLAYRRPCVWSAPIYYCHHYQCSCFFTCVILGSPPYYVLFRRECCFVGLSRETYKELHLLWLLLFTFIFIITFFFRVLFLLSSLLRFTWEIVYLRAYIWGTNSLSVLQNKQGKNILNWNFYVNETRHHWPDEIRTKRYYPHSCRLLPPIP